MDPTNIEEIMKTAQTESMAMESETKPTPETVSETKPVPETKTAPDSETVPQRQPSMDDMKNALSGANISKIAKQLGDDPEKMKEMMDKTSTEMTPEMMEMARKIASGGQGQQLLREMQRQGMDPNVLKTFAKNHKRSVNTSFSPLDNPNQSFFLINSKRQLKTGKLTFNGDKLLSLDIKGIEIPCSRLAQGPLSGKSIKAWYDPAYAGSKNRRASKIAGLRVGGDLLVMIEEGGITEADFLKAEACLA